MPVWNDKYEATPRQGYNPGYGAREFQTLKSRLSDRLAIDHIFGEDETLALGTGGRHKEGSAVVTVFDGNETDTPRATYRTHNTGEIGRISFYIDERVADLEVNEVVGTSVEATREAKIKVISDLVGGGGTLSQETIFDFDKIVNVTFDQSVAGIKSFTDTIRLELVPTANIVKSTEDASPEFPVVTAPVSTEVGVPLSQVREGLVDAKEHNVLDAADSGAYNTIETVDGYDYTMHDVSCQTVRAKYIYGAVWG